MLTLVRVAVVDRRAVGAGQLRPRHPPVHRDGRDGRRARRSRPRSCAGSATGSSTAATSSAPGSRRASSTPRTSRSSSSATRSRCSRCCRRRWSGGGTASSSSFVMLVGVVIAVGAHPYDDPSPFGGAVQGVRRGVDRGPRAAQHRPRRAAGRARPRGAARRARRSTSRRRSPELGLATTVAGRRTRAASSVGVVGLVGVLIVVNLPALWNDTFYGKNLQRPEEVPQYWNDAIDAPRRGVARHARARAARRRLRVVPVGQHRRPDHARAHGPAVRRARADPVRVARRRPTCSTRSTGASRRACSSRRRCWRRSPGS